MCQLHPSFSVRLLSVKIHLLNDVIQQLMVETQYEHSEGNALVTKPM